MSSATWEDCRRKGVASSSLLQHSNFVRGDNVLAPARGSFFQTPFQLGKVCDAVQTHGA